MWTKNPRLLSKLKEHRDIIKYAIEVETKEYDELMEERGRRVLSEDIHNGFRLGIGQYRCAYN